MVYWKLNPETYENDSELSKIREERGYDYMVGAHAHNKWSCVWCFGIETNETDINSHKFNL